MYGRRRTDVQAPRVAHARAVPTSEHLTPLNTAALCAILVVSGMLWPPLASVSAAVSLIATTFAVTCGVHALHEAGHVVAGWLVGLPFESVTVGLFTIRRERRGGSGQRTWHVNRAWMRVGGCVERDVSPAPGIRVALTVTALGGPVASLVGGALLLNAPDPWHSFGYVSLLVGVMNAIPSAMFGQASDGMLVYRLWSRRPAAVAWRAPFCGQE